MKKIFLLCTKIAYCCFANAQQISDRILTFDSTQILSVAPPISDDKDFNVLLSKTIIQKWIAPQYAGFVDTALSNSYKKINDSTYEILVNNPLKNVYLVAFGDDGVGNSRMLGDFSMSHSKNYGLYYYDGNRTIHYDAFDYNPFFFEYSQDKVLNQRPQVGRKFLFKYKFPKPILALTTTNDSLIRSKKKFPSISFINLIYKKDLYKTDSVFNVNSILFVFEHYGRMARKDINDYLK